MRQIVLSAVNSMAQRWLLIYDNVDSLVSHELQPYLPSGKGSVLITSRNPRWGNMAVLSLPVFTPAESEAFWQKWLGLGSAEQERARAELAVDLGHFPLALEHAAAYIHENEMGADDYVPLFGSGGMSCGQRRSRPMRIRARLRRRGIWPLPKRGRRREPPPCSISFAFWMGGHSP